ncbi:DNA/RNA nuclease SfsA [Trichothermofontia sp.]
MPAALPDDDFLYRYPPLQAGVLIKRYKRFFAKIELDTGEVITAHCPNTGPMTGIYVPGNRVYISHTDNPRRKLAYTWEMIAVPHADPSVAGTTWVGVNTSLPNRIVKLALERHLLPHLGPYTEIHAEVPYGPESRSRIDFLLTPDPNAPPGEDQRPCYIEVKNTTWTQGPLALFPDTVTTRGQKHLHDLQALLPAARAVMLYFINRDDCPRFAPGDQADPAYGELLRSAIAAGLTVLPCRFQVTPEGVRYGGLAEFLPQQPGSQ